MSRNIPQTQYQHQNIDFFATSTLVQSQNNFFETPFDVVHNVEEPKFVTLADKKKSNVRIAFNNTSFSNPSFMTSGDLADDSIRTGPSIKRELFKNESNQNKLAVSRNLRDNSFSRPSIPIFKEVPNRSSSNRSQKVMNGQSNPLDRVEAELRAENGQERRLSNGSKSFEVHENSSVVSKNSKSPLNVMILDSSRKTKSNLSNHSRKSHLDNDELTGDPIMLKTMLVARNAEIRHLNQKIDALHEMREHKELLDSSDPQQSQLNSFRIKKLEEEAYALRKENQSVKTENDNLKRQLQKNKSDMNQQMFNMKLKFEENARKNMEVMEREVAFKYASDENETLRYMKERIISLEATLKGYQQGER